MADGHRIKRYSHEGEVWARCACERWASGRYAKTFQWQVEDEVTSHLRDVEKALAALARRNASLPSQARYYRKMEVEDPIIAHRATWRVLAEELEQRLAEKTLPNDEHQPPLF